jgi:leader peptidase (prepilin peptidase)/N-methyltransferase
MNLTLLIPVFLGWLAGWIVNYLADVLPLTRRFTQPACAKCGAPLPWARYLLLQGCAACGQKRSPRTYATQGIALIASVYIWINPPEKFSLWLLGFFLLVYFGVVFVIDLEHRLILHPVSIAGAILALVVGSAAYGPLVAIEGGAAGFGIMFAFYYLGELFRRYMSKRRGQELDDALGFGDVNLAGVIGLALGWPLILAGLTFAILAGGAISLLIVISMLIAKKYTAGTAIPYAPFLILGAVIILYR